MTRIRIIHADGTWAPRLGCEGYIVEPTPQQAKIYPFHGLGKNEVVIKLDDDPLARNRPPTPEDYWSCAINKADIEVAR